PRGRWNSGGGEAARGRLGARIHRGRGGWFDASASNSVMDCGGSPTPSHPKCRAIPYCGMTSRELCELTGLSSANLQQWRSLGLFDRAFGDDADQLERVHLIRALQSKGVKLSLLARENLAFDGPAIRGF